VKDDYTGKRKNHNTSENNGDPHRLKQKKRHKGGGRELPYESKKLRRSPLLGSRTTKKKNISTPTIQTKAKVASSGRAGWEDTHFFFTLGEPRYKNTSWFRSPSAGKRACAQDAKNKENC